MPAHAPGEPGWVILGKLATLIPLGSIAFRVNLLSALCGALAGGLAYRIALELLAPADSGSPPPSRLAALLSITPLLTYPLWIQAVRAEVYTLELMLALFTLWALLRAGVLEGRLEPRWTLTAALSLGLNLAVHPLLAVLAALPPALLALFRPRGFAPALWARAGAVTLLGFSTILLMPLRATAHAGRGWGRPLDLPGVIDMLLARDFQRNFSPLTGALVWENLAIVADAVRETAGPVPPLLALGAPVLLLLERRFRTVFLLTGLVIFDLWSILPQNKVFNGNPDFHGYLAPLHLVIWWGGAYTCTRVVGHAAARLPQSAVITPRLSRVFAPVFLAALALPAILSSVPASHRGEDRLARRHGLEALRGLAPGGVLQASGNDTMFILQYLQEVEHLRPDVLVLPRTLLSHPWYRARLPFEDSWKVAAAGPVGPFNLLVTPRTLRVELRDIDLRWARQLCPVPAPGWGFYEIAERCPVLENTTKPAASGLTSAPDAYAGPQALLVGLNARAYLADYYAARGRTDWAEAEKAVVERLSGASDRSDAPRSGGH